MPKRAAGLTARAVQTIKTPGLHADGANLYLQVTATGARTWIFRFQIGGRRREMGLGSAAQLSLAGAREKAVELRKLVADGIDPLEHRKVQAAAAQAEALQAVTFRDCAAIYVETMRPGWSSAKHADQWSSTLETYAYPVLGALPVAAIDTGLVLQVLQPIWTTKTETASRVRGRIEAVLDYATVRQYRTGENPARWKGHLDLILPAKGAVSPVEHHASLDYRQMPTFWPRLQVQDGASARALELCVLTATRSGEVLGAKWAEIDFTARTWTIPAERMKARLEHRVPLSAPAITLLKKLRARDTGSALVFEGQSPGRPLSNMAMAMVLRRMKVDATPHGFRSTFRTWAAEKTNFAHEVCEAALAHTIGDRVVAAYQRGDLFEKRRDLMEAWAQFISTEPTA